MIPPPIRVADNGNYFDWWWQAVAQSSPPKGPAHVNAFILIDVTRRLIEREKAGAPRPRHEHRNPQDGRR